MEIVMVMMTLIVMVIVLVIVGKMCIGLSRSAKSRIVYQRNSHIIEA